MKNENDQIAAHVRLIGARRPFLPRFALKGFMALMTVVFSATGAHAAAVTWGAAVTDSANSDIFNVGASSYGWDGAGSIVTVNGVAFSGTSNSTTVTFTNVTNNNTSAFGGGGSAPYSTLSAGYQTLLQGANYNSSANSAVTVNLNALTSGHVYATEFWIDDSRAVANKFLVLSSAGGNSVSLTANTTGLTGGLGQFAIGGFTASGTTQAFSVTGTNGYVAQINSVQVRDVTGVWSGATNGNWDNSTANFTGGNSFSTVSGLVSTVYFADTDGFGNAVTNNNITIQSGGVSIANVVFQNNKVNYTLSSSDTNGITGATAVTLSGTGTVTLLGTNSYTGATTINSGTYKLGATGLLGASGTYAGSIIDNGGFVDNSSASQTLGGIISGSGTLAQSGSSTLTLTAANTYTGPATISTGTLQIGGAGSLGTSGTYAGGITDNGAFVYNSSASQTLSAAVSGSGALTQSGPGTLTLTAANTYTGATTISSGTLQVGAGGTTGSLASTNITDNGTLIYSRSDTIDLTGTYTGTGNLVLNGGAGTIGIRGPINLASVSATSSFASTVVGLYGSNYGSAINLFANVTTTGNQTYNGIVSIGRGSTNPVTVLTTTAGGNIVLANGVVSGLGGFGTAGILTLDTSAGNGNVTLGGQSGAYAVGNLNITSGTGTINLTGGLYDYDYSVFNGNVAVTGTSSFSYTAQSGQYSINGLLFNGNLSGTTLTITFGNGSTGATQATGTNGLVFNTGTTQLVSANIAGTAGPTKTGTGVTIFTGTNTYTGTTTVNSGTLQLGNGGTAGSVSGSSAISGLSGGTLAFDLSSTGTFANTISGGVGVAQIGTGATTLTATNGYTGATTISSGTLQIGGAGSLGPSSNYAGNISDTAALVYASSSNQILSGVLSGSGGTFTVNGPGTVTLTGSNTFSGSTLISGGTLQIGAGGTTGSLANSTITDNAALVYNRSDRIDLTGTYNGTGSLTLIGGAGTIGIRGPINLASVTATSTFASTVQTLYGTNYASAINLFANVTTTGNQTYNGIVSIGRGSTNPVTVLTTTAGGNIVLANGVVSGLGGFGTAGILTIDTSAGNGNVTLGGQSLAYAVGNLNIASGTGTINLTGGIYDYDYSVFNGNVAVTGTSSFSYTAQAGQYSINGLAFDGSLTGSGNTLAVSFGNGSTGSTMATGTNGLFFNSSATQLVSVNISAGANGLTKTGAGTTILTGSNSYSGGTTVTGGTLRLGNAFALGGGTTGPLAINSSTLDMNGFSASVGTFSGASGALVTLLTSTGTSTLTTGGTTNSTYAGVLGDGSGKLALTVAGSGTLALTGSNSYSGGTTISNGTVQLGASSGLSLATSNALGTGGLTLNNGTLNLDDYNITIAGAISGSSGTITDLSPGGGGSGGDGSSLTLTSGSYGGVIADGVGVNEVFKSGPGVLALTGSNTYGYGTEIDGGTLQINNSSALGTGTDAGSFNPYLNFNGGTLQLIANVTINNSQRITNDGSTAVFDTNGFTLNEGDVIMGSGGLVKNGLGTLVLKAANTYTGATTVNSGTLNVALAGTAGNANGGTLGATAITVNTGGTLLVSASNAIGTSSTVNLAGGKFAVDPSSEGTGARTVNGSVVSGANTSGMGALTLSANSTLDFTSTASTLVFASFATSGTLNVINYVNTDANVASQTSGIDNSDSRLIFNEDIGAAGLLGDISFNGVSGAGEIDLGGGFFEVAPVPEPATILAGVLLLAFLGVRERKRMARLCRGASGREA